MLRPRSSHVHAHVHAHVYAHVQADVYTHAYTQWYAKIDTWSGAVQLTRVRPSRASASISRRTCV